MVVVEVVEDYLSVWLNVLQLSTTATEAFSYTSILHLKDYFFRILSTNDQSIDIIPPACC